MIPAIDYPPEDARFVSQFEHQVRAYVEAARRDPFAAQHLVALQDQVMAQLEDVIRVMAQGFVDDTPLRSPVMNGRPMNVAAMASMARARQTTRTDRLELAAGIIYGTLVNEHNPDWNVMQPSTYDPSAMGAIAALLSAKIELPLGH